MPAAPTYGDASLRSAETSCPEEGLDIDASYEDEVEDGNSYQDEVDDADEIEAEGIARREELGYAKVQFWRNEKADGSYDWSVSIESAPLVDWKPDQVTTPKLRRHYIDFGPGGIRRLKANRIMPRVKSGELSPRYLSHVDAWAGKHGSDALMGPVGNSRYTGRKRRIDESTNARQYFNDQFAVLKVDKTTGLPTRLVIWLNDAKPIVITDIKKLSKKPVRSGKAPPVALAYYDPHKLALNLRHDMLEAERLRLEHNKLTHFHPASELGRMIEDRTGFLEQRVRDLEATVSTLSKLVTDLLKQDYR